MATSSTPGSIPSPSSPRPTGSGERVTPTSYRQAGVDMEAGYETVRRIRELARRTYRPEVRGDIGSFGGFFALDPTRWRRPLLVSGSDGVGTKLKIAFLLNRHDTVGIDCVAYCVNDILCQGAEPLFFLDYYATGHLDPARAEQVVAGVAEGCRQAGCALIGGETAEMPGFYPEDEYDLAGFAVGVVEEERVITGQRVRPADVLLGLASTGLQSSGYSLVRKIVLEQRRLPLDRYLPELGRTLGEELLAPTAIYVRPVLRLLRVVDVHGLANISGGGLPENVPRAMGEGKVARVRVGSWPEPPIFDLLRHWGPVEEEEMRRTFNLGLGMVAILPTDQVDTARRLLQAEGIASWPVGEVVASSDGRKGVEFV
ncbi:MAG: phosphoribosylformylglycinamidine cyclo-ligase [Limnochordaceae bacterium]|nr:phosphoribosylformylglycinamidine cyclo-ligase [Limnochordaceae bacterium]